LTVAFIISLVAGVLIILGSLYAALWGIGMMSGIGVMMGEQAYSAMTGTWILGLTSGIIVLISAIMLNIRPGEATHGDP
jgi:hypothetical protein